MCTATFGAGKKSNPPIPTSKPCTVRCTMLSTAATSCSTVWTPCGKKTTDDKDLDKLDQCCGEAYFARALAYSELVKLFCKAYESDEDAAGQLGVILSEHYLGDETMRRASLKDSTNLSSTTSTVRQSCWNSKKTSTPIRRERCTTASTSTNIRCMPSAPACFSI